MKKILLSVFAYLLIHNISKAQSLTDSLIAVYKMTGNANDSTSNGNNGTLFGTTPTTDRFGVAGGALHFNGTSDYIDITPGNSKFKPSTFPISVCAWIRYTSTTFLGGAILVNDLSQNTYHGVFLSIVNTANTIAISYGSGGAIGTGARRSKFGTTDLSDGQWHFVAGVVRGPQDMDLYVDCKNDGGTYSGTGGIMSYDSNHGSVSKVDQYASGGNPYDYFTGDIDEIRFYHRELTPSDIYRLYKNSNNPFPSVSLGQDQIICIPNSFTITPAINNANSFLWSNSSTSQNITISIGGNYSITVTDSKGCKASDDINVSFVVCEGVEQNQNLNAIELNFNSENNLILIRNLQQDEKYSFELYNSIGQKIISENKILGSTGYEFKVPDDLPNEFYLFTVTAGSLRKTIKLIKN